MTAEAELTESFAKSALDNLKGILQGRNNSTKNHHGTETRYDRMERKDFSRKNNSFAPVLINDSYANFRFSKRAGEVLSPLSKSKFGFTMRSNQKLRKLSYAGTNNTMDKSIFGDAANSVQQHSPKGSTSNGFNRFAQKSLRHKSLGGTNLMNRTEFAGGASTSRRTSEAGMGL